MDKKYHKDHILIISDLHAPYELPGYLEFCLSIRERVKCGTIVFIGDLCDNSAISFHDHDPDGKGPEDEMKEADIHLAKWFKAFPIAKICLGNHDRLPDRKRRVIGLPQRCFQPFRDIWNLPIGWEDKFRHKIDGVIYMHGTGLSGDMAHIRAASLNRTSTVIGHTHSGCAVTYLVSDKDRIFGMNVGSGINNKAIAFEYGREFLKKPVISCGVVTDNGNYAQVFPMDL